MSCRGTVHDDAVLRSGDARFLLPIARLAEDLATLRTPKWT